jgi:UDP-N-acetylglucosamine acyltransferase
VSTRIHSTAVIHPGAHIGNDCEVGPYCIIGSKVKLGDGCRLISHVVVDGCTTIGERCEFYPFACLGMKTQDLKYTGGDPRLEIGSDNVFREHVTVHTATNDGGATVIGSHSLFLISAHVAHDCIVGDHVIMSGFAGLAGHILVEDYAILSGYAAIHQFCRIGTMSIVAGCARVVQDVPPYMIADGHPAGTRGVNKVGLERNGVSEVTQRALRDAFKILFKSGLTVQDAISRMLAELPPSKELEHFIDFCRKSERGIAR